MRKQSSEQRFQAVRVPGGYQVEDGADGKRFPHIYRWWTQANNDALRRERGNSTPFKPNLKQLQARLKLA